MSAVLGGEHEMDMLDVTRVDNDRAQVLLQELAGGKRVCCLYTDMWTGMGIAQVKLGVLTTHMHTQALLRRLLKESRVSLTKVLLFHREGSENLEARLFLRQDEREYWVDCRAADGVAQAMRWKLPILMDGPSLDRAHYSASAVPQGTGSA
jgi:bifunctional DNase/RNase